MRYTQDRSTPDKKELKQMLQGTALLVLIAVGVSLLILIGFLD